MSNQTLSVIDALTESIHRFVLGQNEKSFENDLDFIMSKMDNIEIEDTDQHWEDLQKNYSKLRYLYEVINFYHLPTSIKFIQSLKLFMESIDKKTQIYLREIDWYENEPDLLEESMEIKKCLDCSLNENDPIKKLHFVLKAYKILVPIVEDIRNEKCESDLDDDFLETFEPPKKKAKHNEITRRGGIS
jgi:hypothetical protein